MKIRLIFGAHEPPRETNWWQPITAFPPLVLFKDRKWEFGLYNIDDTGQVDYICYFSEVQTYDPNWHSTEYERVDHLFNEGYGRRCECGAIYTSFPWDHMRMCPLWGPW